jgi:Tol biopolymer transport system component
MLCRPQLLISLVAALVVAAPAVAADSFQPGATTLVSRSDGFGPLSAQADGNSSGSANGTSADGRFTVFTSDADDLGVSGPDYHVFVRDDQTGAVTVLDRAGPGGPIANNRAYGASISADGTKACFVSNATNLVGGVGGQHAYVVSIATGAIVAVDRSTGGTVGNSYASGCVLDADGNTAAFESGSHNLVAGVTTGYHVYVRHLDANTTQLVDSYQGTPSDGGALAPSIDAAGATVAFETYSTNLNGPGGDQNFNADVYARALGAAQPVLVSRATMAGGAIGDGDSRAASISADGTLVAFSSTATNLGDGDTDANRDIHLRNLVAATTTLVSRAEGANGAKGNGRSYLPTIAGDGSAVAFTSDSTNLGVDPGRNEEGSNAFPYLRVLNAGHTVALGRASGAAGAISQGSYDKLALDHHATNVVFTSSNTGLDPLAGGVFGEVFQRHLADGFETRLISRPSDASGRPAAIGAVDNTARAISADGRFVVFTTTAPLGGPSGTRMVYVRDVLLGTTRLVSRADGVDGPAANMESIDGSISADGTKVAFTSFASNLPGGDGVHAQTYVRDLVTGTTTLASAGPSGAGDGYSSGGALSQDGTKVAFSSSSGNLVAGDANGHVDVFVHDLSAGTIVIASLTSTGAQVDGESYTPMISADGTRIGFTTSAQHVVPDEADGSRHLYVRDLAAGTTTQVDRKADGSPSDSPADRVSMSADGNRFLFTSYAKLTPDSATTSDAYLRDMAAGTTTAVAIGPGGERPAVQVFPGDISLDGTKVMFGTDTGTFGGGDPGGGWLRDLNAGTTTLVGVRDGSDVPAKGSVHAPSLDADGNCLVFQSTDSTLASPSYAGQDVSLLWLHAAAGECPVHAPDTTITSGPDGKAKVREAYSVFGYQADESNATFACSLDGTPMKPCGDTFHTGALRDGVHRFSVAAIDHAGNTDPTPALVTFTVGVPPRVTKLRLDRRGRLVFELSEKATVRVRLVRTGRAHSAKVSKLTIKRSLKAGKRRIKLPVKRLRKGHYRATVVATDAGGNRSVPKRKSFDVRPTSSG